MEILIRGDKIKITDAMKEYAEAKMERLNKYLKTNDSIRATIIAKAKKHEQTVEITLPLNNFILRAEGTQADFYAAIDVTLDKIEKQIKKNKTRINKNEKTNIDFAVMDFEEEEKEQTNKIVKRKVIEVKPMDEEEAILQMELLEHNFFMYKDAETGKSNVIYKRKDGNYGTIESE